MKMKNNNKCMTIPLILMLQSSENEKKYKLKVAVIQHFRL